MSQSNPYGTPRHPVPWLLYAPTSPRPRIGSARQVQADAVALSVIYPKVDAGLISDLDELRGGLDRRTPILLGGASAAADRERLTSLGTQVMGSLDEFRASLRELRQPA